MARKNRPAHGGVSFHRCDGRWVLALHDSNQEAFAHIDMDAGMVGGLAGEMLAALLEQARLAGVAVKGLH